MKSRRGRNGTRGGWEVITNKCMVNKRWYSRYRYRGDGKNISRNLEIRMGDRNDFFFFAGESFVG